MEAKRIAEDIKMTNDAYFLSLDELKEKYLKDSETYSRFLASLSSFFLHDRGLYDVRMGSKYEAIKSLFAGTIKDRQQEDIDHFESILAKMNLNNREYYLNNSDHSMEGDSIFSLGTSLGLDAVSQEKYESILRQIESGATAFSTKTTSCKPFLRFVGYLTSPKNVTREAAKTIIEGLISKYDMLELCNKKDFLVFVNFATAWMKDLIDDNFLTEAECIIEASKSLQAMGKVDKDFDAKDYNKYANHTLRSIKKAREAAAKDRKNGAKKIKDFFTKG